MKQHTKWFMTALAMASGLMIAGSAKAQTQLISNLQITPTVTYANWNDTGDPATSGYSGINGGNGYEPTLTSGPSGLDVNASGYGSLHYDIPSGNQIVMNSAAAEAILTLTVNNIANPSANVWIGVPFLLDDNQGGSDVSYGGYAGMFGYSGSTGTAVWSGNTLTETVPLYGATLAAAESGTGQITGFNVQLDPAVLPAGVSVYDVTFNSLAIAVPEPTTLALLGLGAVAGLVMARRRAVKLV
jgi:PEP-CTERM motif